MDQKNIYNHLRISKDYASREYLDKAETQIIDELKDVLPRLNMLDMGVGGGRTTGFFLPLVNSYIGADYAPNMIVECKKKFKSKKIFEVMDVRNMNKFNDNMFDFILFSYNGIDSFGPEDRETALMEIKRVLRNGGYFSFSTHNINWNDLCDLFTIKNMYKRLVKKTNNAKNPFWKFIIFFKSVSINLRLNFQNKSLNIKKHIENLRKDGQGGLIDNSLNGKASIFYTSYKSQIQQLKKFGFKDIAAYSVNGIKTEEESELNKGGWIYYLCKLEK